jgi:hydroxymethylbilane synthase
MDLRSSPPDFFTKDLDEAIINGQINAAVHSAKDMPEQVRPELDWCWLPIKEDPRDAIVLPKGKSTDEIHAEQ